MKSKVLVLTLVSIFQIAAWAENYQTALVCDDGAAVVDVDLSERKNIQLVIRNPKIVQFLYESGIFDRSLVPLNCKQQGNQLKCDPPSEIIIRGRNHIVKGSQQDPGNLPGYPFYLGVFNKEQISSVDAGDGLGSRPTLRFQRDGKGLRVAGYGFRQGHCEGFVSPSTGGCQGRVVPGFEFEIANWYFQSCQ
ncbi:MAG: hypothetical protein SGJ18_10465 [Pseudomonadota bacterium]|nr:hypothetical protein [Pseudomonadota bacterium]